MTKANSRITVALLLLLSTPVLFGQTVGKSDWTRVVCDKEAFSIDLPGLILANNEGSRQVLFATNLEGFSASVTREKRDGKQYLSQLRFTGNVAQFKAYRVGKYSVLLHTSTEQGKLAYVFSIGSSRRFYTVRLDADTKNDPRMTQALASMMIDGKPLLQNTGTGALDSYRTLAIESVETSPEIARALKVPDASRDAVRFETVTDEPPDQDRYSRVVLILRKERAEFTDDARRKQISGKILARVTFKADGTIGDIVVDSSLNRGLASNAADAARRIKFLPAQKAGKPVTTVRTVTYSFMVS